MSLNHQQSISIVSRMYRYLKENLVQINSKQMRFIIEPIINGLILFPVIVLFWECGWNVGLVLLNLINNYSVNNGFQSFSETEARKNQMLPQKSSKFDNQSFFHHKKWKGLSRPHPSSVENCETDYSFQSLIISYVTIQIILLCFYLNQDFIYNYLKKQKFILSTILLKCHIFLLASIYILQWEMIWIIWDQYTYLEWYFELFLSFTFVLILILLTGHLSDLICVPFLTTYDSIESCIQFDCPLQTQRIKRWKSILINFILYEIIISNIIIIIWRGFYHLLDRSLYSENWSCLVIGYILYFLIMYVQNYLTSINIKYELWIFFTTNFPQFHRYIYQLLIFFTCVFLWRGFWIIFDTYINIFKLFYQTYLLLYILSFVLLALVQTASSTNGPLSNTEDENLRNKICV
ncbi:hypothetical protein I4U23_004241 [Adineta vaga]|nr:hypothetical protein I4U23_004241 [Adineta vaga]